MSTRGEEFEALMRPLVPVLYRFAFRWTNSVERAEDLVQDLLLRLFPRLDEIRKVERLCPWATRVMYRIFVDALRRERSSPVRTAAQLTAEEEAVLDAEGPADPASDPAELADLELTRERLLRAWGDLNDEHRTVLAMHDIEGYELAELSGVLQVPVGTLKSRLHRARARMRELLARNDSRASSVYRKEDVA
jgi:RNA polymerase sigma factor (sigma-70 family)